MPVMSHTTTHRLPPAAFLVLAVALSLAATADASVVTFMLDAGSRVESVESSDRRAVAQWMDSLKRMAREMRGQSQAMLASNEHDLSPHARTASLTAPYSVHLFITPALGRLDHIALPPPIHA